MKVLIKSTVLVLGVGLFSIAGRDQIQAAAKKTTYYNLMKAPKSYKNKTYIKKASYEGFGKKSKRTGLIKTKLIRGHAKSTSKGYTYVNPYAKSK